MIEIKAKTCTNVFIGVQVIIKRNPPKTLPLQTCFFFLLFSGKSVENIQFKTVSLFVFKIKACRIWKMQNDEIILNKHMFILYL